MNIESQTYLAAQSLKTYIRISFSMIFNGSFPWSKRNLNYWYSFVNNRVGCWNYKFINSDIECLCNLIGIKIDSYTKKLSGLHQFCRLLNLIKSPLRMILPRPGSIEHPIYIKNSINESLYKGSKFRKIPKIFKIIKKESFPGISLYLHGSMADYQYTEFSDIDDLVIVDSIAWENVDSLMHTAVSLAKLARQYQNIDPLQHHGHWIITEFDLLSYDQSYMPLVVLNSASRIIGNSHFLVNVEEKL